MSVKNDIKETIKVLKKLRKFKSQEEVAESLGYNASYFSRTLGGKDIPIDFEEKFFKTFPKSVYLYDKFSELLNDVPEPVIYPSAADQLIKVTDKKKRQKEGVTPIEKDAYMWVEYQDLSAVAGRLGGANVDALPEHKKKLVPNEYDSGSYLVVRVDGDSMQTDSEISIPNGSEILIKEYVFEQGEKLPIRDNLWVIVSREGTVFKQIIDHNVSEKFTSQKELA